MRLLNKRIAVLVDDGFEDLEFWVTVMRLQEEGARVTIVGVQAGKNFIGKGGLAAHSDAAAESVKPEDFDALVVPGGWAPDKLRRYAAIKNLVRGVYAQGKIVGLICHAGLVAISAGIIPRGSRATGSLGIQDDLTNAGAVWADEAAFREGQLVWGRVVADIPAFCRELVNAIEAN
jgi:protease I